jgi:hypothetical protein
MRKCLAYITLCFLTACSFFADYKQLDLGVFSITVPKEWGYNRLGGLILLVAKS